MNDKPQQATDPMDLQKQIMDSCVAKNEREWWAHHKISQLQKEIESLRSVTVNEMAARVVKMCKKREWSMHWTHRGAYLHLEASELIEAIRGKHGNPLDEAGDVLLVLMSITEYAGFPFSEVIKAANNKLEWLETAPAYRGEEKKDEH